MSVPLPSHARLIPRALAILVALTGVASASPAESEAAGTSGEAAPSADAVPAATTPRPALLRAVPAVMAAEVERAGFMDGDRGMKTLYEVGTRTPIFLHWPGRVPVKRWPEELVSSVDLFPTVLDYAGLSTPSDRPGASLRPHLEGKAAWKRDAAFASLERSRTKAEPDATGAYWSIRTPVWHFLWLEREDRHELYRVADDPQQRSDRAAKEPATVAALRRRIRNHRRHLAALNASGAADWFQQVENMKERFAPGTHRARIFPRKQTRTDQ